MTVQQRRRKETIYLHLKPGYYQGDLIVTKMTKSLTAVVEPGTVIVKANVSVAGDFFETNIPTTEIEFTSADVTAPIFELTTEEDPE